MIAKIKAWLASHNVSSHTVASLALAAGGLYVSNDQVKAMVDSFLAGHKNLSALFTVALAAYLKYSHGHKTN